MIKKLTYSQKESLKKLTNEWQYYRILGYIRTLEVLRRNGLAVRKDGEYTGEIYFKKPTQKPESAEKKE